jgi:hypothetical protein
MKIEFIEGNVTSSTGLNGITQDGIAKVELGYLNIQYEFNWEGKRTMSKRAMKIVRQDKWYLHIPILIHELGHYIIDVVYPKLSFDGSLNAKHKLVEKYLDLAIFFGNFYIEEK